MNALFKKLNYKMESAIYVFQPPASLETELAEMASIAEIIRQLPDKNETASFLLGFCTRLAEVETMANSANQVEGDGILWIAYPKATSKKFKCEFNRDTGWESLGKAGFEPVRQVAIDEDWSALRFRKVQYIKKMVRQFAMTEAGKKKSGKL